MATTGIMYLTLVEEPLPVEGIEISVCDPRLPLVFVSFSHSQATGGDQVMQLVTLPSLL